MRDFQQIPRPKRWNREGPFYDGMYGPRRKLTYCSECRASLQFFIDEYGYVWVRCPKRESIWTYITGNWQRHTSEIVDGDAKYVPPHKYDPITGRKL
jgi:hypothetical protein